MHADHSQSVRNRPGPGRRSGLLAAYQVLTSGAYGLMRLGHALIPPLRSRLAPRLAMDLGQAPARPLVHFHAASVGEISSVAPVVREVRKAAPDCDILVTTMTATGGRRAAELIPGARVRLIPFDCRPAMRRFLKTLCPGLIVIAETELWPNLLREASRLGIPLVLVNGRISSRSIGHYRRLRPLVSSMLAEFDVLLMRSEEDATRVRSLGAETERVEVAGNTKYDVLPGPMPQGERAALRERLGVGAERRVVTLGSAREGESEVLLDALEGIPSRILPLVILAPRHLENVPGLRTVCAQRGYEVTLSAGPGGRPGDAPPAERAAAGRGGAGGDRRVLLVNEMGRLLDYYSISDIAVVGGTLRPFGGHNPLEPASQGAVVVVGPHRDNIADDMDYLLSRDAAVLTDGGRLGDVISGILSDPAKMRGLAERAARAVEAGKGASLRCVEAMKERGLLP
jgi:3-deoxy-D-manno-octulosonic-acid transferase